MRKLWLGPAIAILLALPFTQVVSAKPVVKTQTPCSDVMLNGACLNFNNNDTDAIPPVNTLTFNAPRAGTALVTFHGSMVCHYNTLSAASVDLASAIVTDPADQVTPSVPSGLRHTTHVLRDSANSLNLASTLLFKFTQAGSQTFYFKIVRLENSNTNCDVWNGAFTVEFVPTDDGGVVVGQKRCRVGVDCISIGAGSDPGVTVRTFAFTAPGRGTAAVSFHGALFCQREDANTELVDLDAGIVAGAEKPEHNKEGGLRFAVSLGESGFIEHTKEAMNLATTRVFEISKAGVQNYAFKLRTKVIGASTTCTVSNAAFTVRFAAATGTPQIVAQEPCPLTDGACVTFPASVFPETTNTRRTFVFKAPKAGKAIVTFHGSVRCAQTPSGGGGPFVTAQIETGERVAADPSGPGGWSQDMHLRDDGIQPQNWTASRVVDVVAGRNKFMFVSTSRGPVDACELYDGHFVVKYDG